MPRDVAAMLGASARSVARWGRSGRLTTIYTVGGHRRYLADEVRALLQATAAAGGCPEEYLRPGDAAARLNIPDRVLRQWSRSGKLVPVTTFGGHRRFRASEVDALVASAGHDQGRSAGSTARKSEAPPVNERLIDQSEPLLMPREVADLLGLDLATVRYHANSGHLASGVAEFARRRDTDAARREAGRR